MSERQGKFKNNQSKYMKSRAKDGSMRWKLRNQYKQDPLTMKESIFERRMRLRELSQYAEERVMEDANIDPENNKKLIRRLGMIMAAQASGPLGGYITAKAMAAKRGTSDERLFNKPEWEEKQARRAIKYGTIAGLIGTAAGAGLTAKAGPKSMIASGAIIGGISGMAGAVTGGKTGAANTIKGTIDEVNATEDIIRKGRALGIHDREIAGMLLLREEDLNATRDMGRARILRDARGAIAVGTGRKIKDVSDEEVIAHVTDYQNQLKKQGRIARKRSFAAGEFRRNTSKYELKKTQNGPKRWVKRGGREDNKRKIAGLAGGATYIATRPLLLEWKKRAGIGVAEEVTKDMYNLSSPEKGGGGQKGDFKYAKGRARDYLRAIAGRAKIDPLHLSAAVDPSHSLKESDMIYSRLLDSQGGPNQLLGRTPIKRVLTSLQGLPAAGVVGAYTTADNKLRAVKYDRAIAEETDPRIRAKLRAAKQVDTDSDNFVQGASSVLGTGIQTLADSSLKSSILQDRLTFSDRLKETIGGSRLSRSDEPADGIMSQAKSRYNSKILDRMNQFADRVELEHTDAIMAESDKFTREEAKKMASAMNSDISAKSMGLEILDEGLEGIKKAVMLSKAKKNSPKYSKMQTALYAPDGERVLEKFETPSKRIRFIEKLQRGISKAAPANFTKEGGRRIVAEGIAERLAETGRRVNRRDLINGLKTYSIRNNDKLRLLAEAEGVDSLLRGRAVIKRVAPIVIGSAAGIGAYEYMLKSGMKPSAESKIQRIRDDARSR